MADSRSLFDGREDNREREIEALREALRVGGDLIVDDIDSDPEVAEVAEVG